MWTIFKLIFILFFIPLNSVAKKIYLINPVGKDLPKDATVLWENRSLMNCGEKTTLSIYSSLDIQAILSISNIISPERVILETDWNAFSPNQVNSVKGTLNEKEILNYPKDVQRILFYCLSWDESYQLKIFDIPRDIIDNTLAKVMEKKPWNELSKGAAERINSFSEATLREFVFLILRAEAFYSVRGGFNKNPTLRKIPFSWTTPSAKVKSKEVLLKPEPRSKN